MNLPIDSKIKGKDKLTKSTIIELDLHTVLGLTL